MNYSEISHVYYPPSLPEEVTAWTRRERWAAAQIAVRFCLNNIYCSLQDCEYDHLQTALLSRCITRTNQTGVVDEMLPRLDPLVVQHYVLFIYRDRSGFARAVECQSRTTGVSVVQNLLCISYNFPRINPVLFISVSKCFQFFITHLILLAVYAFTYIIMCWIIMYILYSSSMQD